MNIQEQQDKSFSVIIIDEQEIFRHGLHILLEAMGGFTVVAELDNTIDLLEHLRFCPVELVLLDASLHASSLFDRDLIDSMKEASPSTAFIIFAPVLDEAQLLDAVLLGARGYLTKDVPKQTVIDSLRHWQQGAMAFTPAIATLLVQSLVRKCAELEQAVRANPLQNGNLFLASRGGEIPPESSVHALSNGAAQRLTHQEQRVYQLLQQGLSNKQIAVRLAISPYTVGKHIQQILRKLGVSNRTQAVLNTSFEGI